MPDQEKELLASINDLKTKSERLNTALLDFDESDTMIRVVRPGAAYNAVSTEPGCEYDIDVYIRARTKRFIQEVAELVRAKLQTDVKALAAIYGGQTPLDIDWNEPAPVARPWCRFRDGQGWFREDENEDVVAKVFIEAGAWHWTSTVGDGVSPAKGYPTSSSAKNAADAYLRDHGFHLENDEEDDQGVVASPWTTASSVKSLRYVKDGPPSAMSVLKGGWGWTWKWGAWNSPDTYPSLEQARQAADDHLRSLNVTLE